MVFHLPFVSLVNNFTMSCGYCFSITEYLENFIGLKTFQKHNINKSIIFKQISELKLNKQKYWDLSMNYMMLFHTLPLVSSPSAWNSKHFVFHSPPHDYYPANSFYCLFNQFWLYMDYNVELVKNSYFNINHIK